MTLSITVAPELDPSWHPVIERRFDLLLAPLRHHLRNTRIRFEPAIFAQADEAPRYFCELSARIGGGERLTISLLHSDGQLVITEVLQRARRTIARRQSQGSAAELSRTAVRGRTR
ncbi:MAG: hypothetical protein AB7I04_04335 [Pseudomonadales bacterium]